MSDLVLLPTSTAQWQALVSEAEFAADCPLSEDLESYLVFLLMRFANRPDLTASVLAMDYLDTSTDDGRSRRDKLRDVGDQCLLFSGLFPKQAERRMVKVSYFVDLGRSAYQQISDYSRHESSEIYTLLSQRFVTLMDILQTIRELHDGNSNLAPLHAFDLWNDTGSQHAYKIIGAFTDACPIRIATTDVEQAFMDNQIH